MALLLLMALSVGLLSLLSPFAVTALLPRALLFRGSLAALCSEAVGLLLPRSGAWLSSLAALATMLAVPSRVVSLYAAGLQTGGALLALLSAVLLLDGAASLSRFLSRRIGDKERDDVSARSEKALILAMCALGFGVSLRWLVLSGTACLSCTAPNGAATGVDLPLLAFLLLVLAAAVGLTWLSVRVQQSVLSEAATAALVLARLGLGLAMQHQRDCITAAAASTPDTATAEQPDDASASISDSALMSWLDVLLLRGLDCLALLAGLRLLARAQSKPAQAQSASSSSSLRPPGTAMALFTQLPLQFPLIALATQLLAPYTTDSATWMQSLMRNSWLPQLKSYLSDALACVGFRWSQAAAQSVVTAGVSASLSDAVWRWAASESLFWLTLPLLVIAAHRVITRDSSSDAEHED